jgi:hypothetical protein
VACTIIVECLHEYSDVRCLFDRVSACRRAMFIVLLPVQMFPVEDDHSSCLKKNNILLNDFRECNCARNRIS